MTYLPRPRHSRDIPVVIRATTSVEATTAAATPPATVLRCHPRQPGLAPFSPPLRSSSVVQAAATSGARQRHRTCREWPSWSAVLQHGRTGGEGERRPLATKISARRERPRGVSLRRPQNGCSDRRPARTATQVCHRRQATGRGSRRGRRTAKEISAPRGRPRGCVAADDRQGGEGEWRPKAAEISALRKRLRKDVAV